MMLLSIHHGFSMVNIMEFKYYFNIFGKTKGKAQRENEIRDDMV